MAITVKIAGVDKTGNIMKDSINIADELNSRNICSFRLLAYRSYMPKVGNSILIEKGSVKLFAGKIVRPVERKQDGAIPVDYDIQCVDYNELLDRFLVASVYENQTAGYIVKDIIDNFVNSDGITYANVQDGPVISKAVFNYEKASQCLNELAELVGFNWYLDYDKDLHFCARETDTAPISLTATSANFRNMEVERNQDDLRTVQYIRAGNDITDPRTDTFKGDGARRSFTLKFPVAKEPTAVTVNGGAKTIGIQGVETGKDFYWNKGEKEITQDDSGTVLTSSDTLSVTYQGLFPIMIQAVSDSAVAERQSVEGGSGVYESVEDLPQLDTQASAQEKADALLRKYGKIASVITFETDEDGLRAGQLINIDVPIHNLSGTYLISGVSFSTLYSDVLRYQVTALSGEYLGGWVDFFAKLARSGQTYVIRENEVLVRLRKFSENIIASDTFSVSTAAVESRVGYAMVGFSEVT